MRSATWLLAAALGACGQSDDPLGSSGGGGTGSGGAVGGDHGLPGPGWAQRRELVLPDDVLDLGLTNIPLLVRVDASRISYDLVNEFTPDVRFYDGALQTLIPHEVERWAIDAESLFWIRPAVIDDSEAGRSIWMYFGKAGVGEADGAEEVWSEGYGAVWHMAPDGDGMAPDSTGNANTGARAGGGAAFGAGDLSGEALSITASASSLDVPHAASLSPGQSFTVEGWALPDGIDDRARFLVRKRDEYAIETVAEGEGTPRGLAWFQESGERSVTAAAPLDSGEWTHLALVFDAASGTFALYRDGALEEMRAPPSDPAAASDVDLQIGLEAYGYIDEVRISSVARSPSWLAVQNRAARDDLFTFGAPETP
jgi:hypothetical protein